MRKLLLILSLVLTMFMFACGKDKDSNTMPEQNTPVETPTENPPIETPSIDITGVKFTSLIVDYDGQPHSITCENVPNGVTVSYEGNNVIEVGVHTVTAILKDSSGNELGRLTATITINEVKEPTPVVVLGVPTLTIDEYGVVSWEGVENATHYNYIINNEEIKTTTLTTIQLLDGQTISVQAANDTEASEWSYAVTNYDTSDIYEEEKVECYVKFHNTTIGSVVVLAGETVNKPADPVKNNYTFDNWYADPVYMEVFDFSQPIYDNTIVYANYTPSALVDNTYFWVKGSPLITSTVMSSGTGSNWHFIPLAENTANTTYKEFYVTVTVTGATATAPAAFIIMDGFSDDSGRTYWKNGTSDFTIATDGVYNIYFSTEHQYSQNIHIYVEAVANQAVNLAYAYKALELAVPVVSVNSEANVASWQAVSGATGYEVIINNGKVIYTTATSISLPKSSHITVRAVADNKVSRWSLPKANVNVVIVEQPVDSYSVYFTGFDSYQVSPNETVNAPANPTKDGFEFGGWYLDLACTQAVSFPYAITSNTVFYPKWVSPDDWANKIYYNLVTSTGAYIKGLTWNLDNYTFDEYETGVVELTAGVSYYIVKASDASVSYGPYTVNETNKYKMYFSEDNSWDGSNVYIASALKRYYVTNNKGWTDGLFVYMWNSSTNTPQSSWPGVALTYLETNTYGEKIYYFDADTATYDCFILSHGTLSGTSYKLSSQTNDLKFADYTTNAFYFTEKDASGKYLIGTWNK